MPGSDGNGFVYLFDILTASTPRGPDPAFADRMLARNCRLFDVARAQGGVRYSIGSIEFTRNDWVSHYGNRWSDFLAVKHRFDADGILTPGPGLF